MNNINLEQWLAHNKHRVNIRGLENELGCAETTLSHVVSKGKKVPKKWRQPLLEIIEDMGRVVVSSPPQ